MSRGVRSQRGEDHGAAEHPAYRSGRAAGGTGPGQSRALGVLLRR